MAAAHLLETLAEDELDADHNKPDFECSGGGACVQCLYKKLPDSHKSLEDSFKVLFVDIGISLSNYLDCPLRCEEGQIITIDSHFKEIASELQKLMSVRIKCFDREVLESSKTFK